MFNEVTNLTVTLTTNPLFSLPPHHRDFSDAGFIFDIFKIYVEQVNSEEISISSDLEIRTILKDLYAIYRLFEKNKFQEGKSQLFVVLSKMMYHYPLFTQEAFSPHLEMDAKGEAWILDFTLNPFYSHPPTIVYLYYWNKCIVKRIQPSRLILNYWHWYPLLYMMQIKLPSAKRQKYLYPFKYAFESWLKKLAKKINHPILLYLPYFPMTSNYKRVNDSESFLFKYFCIRLPYIKEFKVENQFFLP